MSDRTDQQLIELKKWLESQDAVLRAHFRPILEELQKQDEEQEESMVELEVLAQSHDFEMRKFLLDQIDRKKQLRQELDNEDISPFKEKQYREALKIVEDNIRKFQVSGINEDLA